MTPAAVAQTSLMSRLSKDGSVLLRGQTQPDLLNLAMTLGTPVAEPRDRLVIKALRPVMNADAPTNTLSARYGDGAFPLHTEAAYWRIPPRVLILFCAATGNGNQPTLLLDGDPIRRVRPDHVLATAPWLVSAGLHPFLSPIVGEQPPFRFDRECMRPLTTNGHAAQAQIRRFIEMSEPRRHLWTVGDLLIIDNWRMLHGRGDSTGTRNDRLLLKVMVRENVG